MQLETIAAATTPVKETDILNALYASTEAPFWAKTDKEAEPQWVSSPEFFAENPQAQISPRTEDGIAFIFGVDEETDAEGWKDATLKPTAVFYDGSTTAILIWALEKPLEDRLVQSVADHAGMMEVDECIPMPSPENGWTCTHCDPETFYSLRDLETHFASLKQPANTFNDARLLTEFDIDDPRYKVQFRWTIGPNKESKNWRHDDKTPDVATLVLRLSQHREDKSKDGLAFVTGDMAPGQRLKTAVKALYAIGLDYDKGTPAKQIDDALVKLGCLAIRYTTHSNGKTREQFKRDEIVKWLRDTGQDEDTEIDTDLMRQYLSVKKGWDPSVVRTVKFMGIEHENKGIMVSISHAPMSKNRVLIPLAEPFVIADVASTQQEAITKWAKVAPAMSQLLGLGDALDMTGTDTSRLFYFPRHARNMPWEITISGGDLFDWKTLELENPYEAIANEVSKGSGKSKTKEGKELGRWSMKAAHGFQIVDVLEAECPDKIRGKASSGVDIECPFDGGHTNAGDPDDRACFAVNAGEGSTDWFTISCRHDSCRDYTMLDMLGKMIADGWFPKSVLEDENYNAAEIEDAPQPEVAAKIEKEDKAKATYKDAIDALTPENVGDEIDNVAALIAAAKLTPTAEAIAIDKIKKIAGTSLTKPAIKTQIEAEKGKIFLAECEKKSKTEQAAHGQQLFRYTGEKPNFDDAVSACIRVLKAANEKAGLPIFSHVYGDLVYLNEQGERVQFEEMTQNRLWSELNLRILFVRTSDTGEGPREQVPNDVARHIIEQGYLHLPPAPDVIYAPQYLNADGDVMLSEGYWPERDVILKLNGLKLPKVPEDPPEEVMLKSRDWLFTELLGDFPFADLDKDGKETDKPSKAHALAMLLTHFVRPIYDGLTPLYCIDKPNEGAGGTLLSSLPMVLFDGEENPGATFHYTDDATDFEKKLVAFLHNSKPTIFFDNIESLKNRTLKVSLTSRTLGGRILGLSKNIERPNNFLFVAAGIHPGVDAEMERRCCWIRLKQVSVDPSERTYRHPQLLKWTREHRVEAIGHLFTLVEYWLSVGAPRFTDRKLASFEDWSEVVGGILSACGVKGFLESKSPRILDTTKMAQEEFMRAVLAWLKPETYQDAATLFDFAKGRALAIITGKTPEEEKRNFNEMLARIEGRLFVEKNNGKEHRYKFHSKGDDEIEFGVREEKQAEPVTEPNDNGP